MHAHELILIKMFNVIVSIFFVHSRNDYFNIYNIQRAATTKVGYSELRFSCSARCLMVLYICETFHNNISTGFQITERTRVHGRNGYVQCSEGNYSKSRQTRVNVHVFCMSSHNALRLCEVSWT